MIITIAYLGNVSAVVRRKPSAVRDAPPPPNKESAHLAFVSEVACTSERQPSQVLRLSGSKIASSIVLLGRNTIASVVV